MSVSSALVLPPAVASGVETEPVRTQVSPPVPGNDSSGESAATQGHSSGASAAEDAVKVQWEPPGEIAVYRFLDQKGALILQVPPQQLLELAQAIDQELAQEAVPKKISGAEGGKDNGR
jgi:hypothetical protein